MAAAASVSVNKLPMLYHLQLDLPEFGVNGVPDQMRGGGLYCPLRRNLGEDRDQVACNEFFNRTKDYILHLREKHKVTGEAAPSYPPGLVLIIDRINLKMLSCPFHHPTDTEHPATLAQFCFGDYVTEHRTYSSNNSPARKRREHLTACCNRLGIGFFDRHDRELLLPSKAPPLVTNVNAQPAGQPPAAAGASSPHRETARSDPSAATPAAAQPGSTALIGPTPSSSRLPPTPSSSDSRAFQSSSNAAGEPSSPMTPYVSQAINAITRRHCGNDERWKPWVALATSAYVQSNGECALDDLTVGLKLPSLGKTSSVPFPTELQLLDVFLAHWTREWPDDRETAQEKLEDILQDVCEWVDVLLEVESVDRPDQPGPPSGAHSAPSTSSQPSPSKKQKTAHGKK